MVGLVLSVRQSILLSDSVSCCLLRDLSSFLAGWSVKPGLPLLRVFFLLLTSYSESSCRSRFLGIEPLLVC